MPCARLLKHVIKAYASRAHGASTDADCSSSARPHQESKQPEHPGHDSSTAAAGERPERAGQAPVAASWILMMGMRALSTRCSTVAARLRETRALKACMQACWPAVCSLAAQDGEVSPFGMGFESIAVPGI